MKKAIILFIAAIALAGLADLALSSARKVVYVHDTSMKEGEFWAGRKAHRATLQSPLVPYQLPGPMDGWAGSESKEFSIETPYTGDTRITISFMDSHNTAPPEIQVETGGMEVARITPAPGSGLTADFWDSKGVPSTFTLDAPAARMKDGRGVITFRSVQGSWAVINRIEACPTPSPLALPAAALGFMTLAILYIRHALAYGLLKTHSANAALAAFSLIVSLGILELVMRNFFPQREFVPNIQTVYDPEPEIGFVLRPNVKTTLGFDTNRFGMRDYDRYTKKKPGGVFRVLCIGDSFTFSLTSLENSYPKILERALAGGSNKIEVINAGVAGYGPDEEYLYLKRYGLEFEPDLVIVGFFVGNDITDSLQHPANTAIDGVLIHVEDAAKFTREEISWEKTKREFINRFHLARFVVNRDYDAIFQAVGKKSDSVRQEMNKVRADCITDVGGHIHMPRDKFDPVMARSFTKAFEWLEAFEKLSKENNFKLAIAIMPDSMQFETPEVIGIRSQMGAQYDFGEPQKSLMAEAGKRGIKLFNAMEPMKAEWDGKPIYYCRDTHFNEKGNELFANALLGWLRADNLLPVGVR
ncbi:MAG: SGNH/GDSL hydrolase family protein [Nitrospinae bacterium]|nr:SGNH/GDSL hydrolase family protein [Nitrospinota bacterium]